MLGNPQVYIDARVLSRSKRKVRFTVKIVELAAFLYWLAELLFKILLVPLTRLGEVQRLCLHVFLHVLITERQRK